MGGAWRESSIARTSRPPPMPASRVVVEGARDGSSSLTAAVVGFVVALVTSLGVSLAFAAYLRW